MKRVMVGLSVVLAMCLAGPSQGATVIGDFETSTLGAWSVGAGSGATLSFSNVGVTSGVQSLKVVTNTAWTNPFRFNVNSGAATLAAFRACNRLMLDVTRITSDPGWTGQSNSTLRLRVNADGPNGGWQEVPLTGAVDQTNWSPSDGDKTIRAVWDISAYVAKVGNTIGWLELYFTTVWDGGGSGAIYYIDNVTLLNPGEPVPSRNPGVAVGPKPADKATDLPRDGTVLSWKPGQYTAQNNVYFGANAQDVNTAGPGSPLLVGAGQDPNTFSLGRLQFGQTYYWRVDEVNSADANSPWRGAVWSFTAEPALYIIGSAPGGGTITATASSTATGASAQNTANRNGLDANDLHSDADTAMWLSGGTDVNAPWIQYAFDRVYKLDSMWVWNYNAQFEDLIGLGIKDALIEYSADGVSWTKLGDFIFEDAPGLVGYAHNTTVNFGGVAAKFVKITAVSNWGGNAQSGLSEVRFFDLIDWARTPQPANNATGLGTDVALSWRPGREAATHDVYLGTDPNVLTKTATASSAAYALAALNLGTKYYWRIDEVNTAASPATWTGDVWTFTTSEYVIVDDMESYNDTTNKIFETWVDGYGTNTNGSQVGYGTSAKGTFGETTIIHGGKQSMPFAYSNKSPIAYSEATRTFSAVQDWSTGGANTLSLWIRGVPTNFIENNGVILMNGDGADIYGAADAFHFAYKQLSGDCTIIAKVESLDATDVWAKAGVMIRATLDPASQHASNFITPSGVNFEYRPTAGAAMTSPSQAGLLVPYWVKLIRTGDLFRAQHSADGITWVDSTTTPTATVVMPKDVYVGLAVTSHNATLVTQARFSNVSTTPAGAANWTVVDVGTTNPAGNGFDTLYLALEDGAGHRGVATPDPYAIFAGAWQQLKIPLSTFSSAGVNLKSVKKVSIGVGDKTKPATGATGTLYLDDVAFGHPAQ